MEMNTFFKENQEVNILPENVKGAAIGKVIKAVDEHLEVEIPVNDVQFYHPNSPIELFVPAEEGMAYATTVLESVENNIVKMKLTNKSELLQRREFTRIPLNQEVLMKDDNTTCRCLDISAGGMKIESDRQLDMEKDYTISFSLDTGADINCYLRPIRISKDENSKYIVSGRFVLLTNIDKIAIVQYCFRKKIGGMLACLAVIVCGSIIFTKSVPDLNLLLYGATVVIPASLCMGLLGYLIGKIFDSINKTKSS